jgi:hypothetical protein
MAKKNKNKNNKGKNKADRKAERKAAKERAQQLKAQNEAAAQAVIERDRIAAQNQANTQAVIERDRAAAQNNSTPGLEFPTQQTQSPPKQEFPEPVRSSNNSSNASAQQAVEKTKAWSEMSKAEKKATNMTKKEYNRQNQKSGMTANYDVENLSDFDLAGGGAGAHLGEQRLSFKDLQGLDATGKFTREELVNYADQVSKDFGDNEKGFGNKAEKLVENWRSKLPSAGTPDLDVPQMAPEPTPEPQPTPEPTPEPSPSVTQTITNNPAPTPDPSPQIVQPSSSPATEANTLKDDYVNTIITETGSGNNNIQDVSIEQGNTQIQTVTQDNDINSNIAGNNNVTEITQDNTVKNFGGDQSNFAAVTNSPESQAQDLLTEYINDKKGSNTAAINPDNSGPDYSTLSGQDLTNPDTFMNFQKMEGQQDNQQTQSVQQDNDINSNITGNNNITNISQDNSVRNYGGDQRNFTYVSNNKNGYTDTPASMATMAGFYEVSDSPASNAAFIDRYSTQNFDNQKRYGNTGKAAEMIQRGSQVAPFKVNEYEDSIMQGAELARARSTVGLTNVFGDMGNFPLMSWNSPNRQKGVESPDFEKLADKISDGF